VSGLELLTGPDAGDLLAAAVGTAGGQLDDWRVSQVDHRPGEVTTVAYRARVRWPDGERDDVLGASVSAGPAFEQPIDADSPASPAGVLTLSDGEQQVAVWCVPHDPDLPGLSAALDPGRLGRLLASFGVEATGLRIRLIGYRPRQRAVIRISAAGGTWYLKVLRPGQAAGLHHRHRLLHEAGVPVPRSLGWSDHGLLVLENLPGTGLRSLLAGTPDPDRLPSAADLLGLLDRFPDPVLELPRRPAWSLNCDRYAEVIAAALPSEGDRVREFARTVLAGVAGADPGQDATHGDFYEAQLMVTGGRVSGLLDVDTAGPGHRADDLACALGHLEALAISDPAATVAASALATRWRNDFGHRVDPEQLRLREAGVRIGLATGPHRVQRPDWPAVTIRALDGIERLLDADPVNP
jgi:aminoglycoside phosphotransferase